jgi:hypothetical protein
VFSNRAGSARAATAARESRSPAGERAPGPGVEHAARRGAGDPGGRGLACDRDARLASAARSATSTSASSTAGSTPIIRSSGRSRARSPSSARRGVDRRGRARDAGHGLRADRRSLAPGQGSTACACSAPARRAPQT